MRTPIVAALTGWAGRLRYPYLFALTAGLFVLDLLIPDMIPLADEILLGLAAVLLGSRQDRSGQPGPPRADP